MGEEAMSVVEVNEAVFAIEHLLKRSFKGVVRQKDEAGFDRFEFGDQPGVGHVTAPEPFKREHSQAGRHGNAGMEGVNRVVRK